jgi:hypothetical protein
VVDVGTVWQTGAINLVQDPVRALAVAFLVRFIPREVGLAGAEVSVRRNSYSETDFGAV